jgi:hypothetical protein
MEFMGRHNLFMNIKIGWIKNSGNTYTCVNNMFITTIIWFHSNTINNILWWKPTTYKGNLSIHMLVSFCVANSKACDSMFSQFVVYALLSSKLCINVFLINWYVFHACYMSHSMWNGQLWKYVHYQRKEWTIIIVLYNNFLGLDVHYNAHNKLYEIFFPLKFTIS